MNALQRGDDVMSLGPIAQLLQRHPMRIKAAIVELSIRPAIHINGAPHYLAADVERLAQHFAAQPPHLVTRPATNIVTRSAAPRQNGEEKR